MRKKFFTRVQPEPPPMEISLEVLAAIRRTIGTLPPEHGGVLGGRAESGIVTEFHLDRSGRRDATTYSPDVKTLNQLFADVWNPDGIRVMGFVHSHPGLRQPSRGDLAYSRNLLSALTELDRLLIPIVIPAVNGERFEIFPFAVQRNAHGFLSVPIAMTVLDDHGNRVVDWEHELDRKPALLAVAADDRTSSVAAGGVGEPTAGTTGASSADAGADVSETFRRVVGAYDLDLLRKSRIIYIGVGGAAGFIEDLARCGVGQHVLIDPDVVSETNLGTQQTYRWDVGRPKVRPIAERIKDINPDAFILALDRSLDDIDDREFEFLARAELDGWPVRQTLICGLTDSFEAQARVNRLALQFGLLSLCAQVYQEGRGAEVTFTHPEVTPACHRCVLGSRYRAHVDGNYTNDVTSDGTPIFATTRLNSLKGFVAMALLHHGTSHPRWGGLLNRIGDRNLVQIRMDPDLATTIGLGTFDRVLGGGDGARLLFDETVWLPQQPEGPATGFPACLDCGGTGDLTNSTGKFNNTRVMRTK